MVLDNLQLLMSVCPHSALSVRRIPFTEAGQNRVDAASDSSEIGYQTLQFQGG